MSDTTKPITFAIIGSGYMATEHIKAIIDSNECKISGIYSRNYEKSQGVASSFGIPFVAKSIEDLYVNCKPKVVIVAVSELACLEVLHEVIKYEWIPLIEKPVGYNFQEAKRIYEHITSLNKATYVALNRRHYSSTRSVLQECNASDETRVVNVLDQEHPLHATATGTPEIIASNYMYANSIHLIDYFNIFCRGKLNTVTNVIKWNPVKPGPVLSKLEFSSGDIGIYQAAWNAPGPWSVSISTNSSRWEMRPLEKASKLTQASRIANDFTIHEWDKLFKPGLRAQIAEVIKLVRREKSSLATLSDSMNAVNIINQIYEP